jgi:hypothetical protein
MPIDTAPSGMTATTAARTSVLTSVPTSVLTSSAEAIRAARDLAAFLADGAIGRDRSGVLPVREPAAEVHVDSYLLNDVSPNHGQV